jgi:hypothetical protein
VIEDRQYLITSTIYQPIYITINEINYEFLNPLVFSSLTVKFTTPRDLYPNEDVAIDMGKDLNDVNSNTDRLSVRIYRASDNEELSVAVAFEQ